MQTQQENQSRSSKESRRDQRSPESSAAAQNRWVSEGGKLKESPAGDAAKEAASMIANQYDEAKGQISGFVKEQADNAGEFTNQAMKQAKSYGNEMEEMIKKHPLSSVAVAAGLGVGTALLFSSRKSHDHTAH